ncbi:hypothetical protein EYF80_043515 [Liparis tanakae]|uniref:Uncharacterized protein n=1 Tax=Liparis tanakae TaxID=230148 RepID=A0A4Z2FYJ8_9TELE|nr:hypothetical protein EYF80_043515 [Liparis tanakae]
MMPLHLWSGTVIPGVEAPGNSSARQKQLKGGDAAWHTPAPPRADVTVPMAMPSLAGLGGAGGGEREERAPAAEGERTLTTLWILK